MNRITSYNVCYTKLLREESPSSPLRPNEMRDDGLEAALAETLDEFGIPYDELAVTRRQAGNDPFVAARARFQARLGGENWRRHNVIVAGVKQAGLEEWQVLRMPEPPPPEGTIRSIILQTLMILTVLVTLLYVLLRRITRPLAQS